MRLSLPPALLVCVLAAIAAFWWYLGRPVTMPPSPLAAGEKIPCVSYSPFRRGQSPFTKNIVIPPSQIDDDFARLAKVTGCVRTYAVDQGLEQVPALARKHGLAVILGLWLGRDAAANRLQIDTAVRLANANRDVVRMLVVGNETLLRGEIGETDLGTILKDVKARVDVPITYADVWEFWVRHRALADLVDVVTVHILPYWEDEPVATTRAAAHIGDVRRQVGQVFAGKPILIGETGWPSQGRMRWSARATPADQARVLHDILALWKREGFDVNLVEAFDQPWKRLSEGTVGGFWGLLDADSREPKFHWGEAVSNHPGWKQQAALGWGLALLVFAAAQIAGWRREIFVRSWLAVALLAAVSGSTIGLAVHMQTVSARTPFELGQGVVYLLLAAGGPVIAAAALVRGLPPASFARLLGSPSGPRDLESWLGAILVMTAALALFFALGLVFDPRYREFPTAVLMGPATGIVLASLLACGMGGLSERVFAAVLTACAIAIVLQERISNWEALGFSATLIVLAAILVRPPAAREPAAAAPAPAR